MWNFIGRWHIWGILWNVSVFLVKIEAKIGVSVSGKRRFLHSYPIWSNKKGLLIKNLAQLFKCTVFKHKIWHVAKVQKKTAGSLFSEDIAANIGIVMLQEWLNDGPWSSWYLTRTFSTSFVSNYSQPNWTGEGGCPRDISLCEDTQMFSFTQHCLAGMGEDCQSSLMETWVGHSIKKRNNLMVLVVHKQRRKQMADKCQVIARGGPQRLVRIVGTA